MSGIPMTVWRAAGGRLAGMGVGAGVRALRSPVLVAVSGDAAELTRGRGIPAMRLAATGLEGTGVLSRPACARAAISSGPNCVVECPPPLATTGLGLSSGIPN